LNKYKSTQFEYFSKHLGKKPKDHLIEYRQFMQRICPALASFTLGMDDAGYDDIDLALPGEACDKKDKTARAFKSNKSSPSSSKKTTPEKEKGYSHGASTFSDMENILSIPQSPAFLNALFGRILYDFIKSSHGQRKIKELINKKFYYMKKPNFVSISNQSKSTTCVQIRFYNRLRASM
jgi:hypothetical protein